METILIEVDDKIAKAWHKASDDKRRSFGNQINVKLAKEFIDNSSHEYSDFLEQLRFEMKQKGLKQEELDRILNE